MDKKKSKWVHVKMTDAERRAWQEQAHAEVKTLAIFIRRVVGAKLSCIAPRKRSAAPALLVALGRIGNNLN